MSRPAGSTKANVKAPSREFFCFRCGSRYTKQESNFSKVRSGMYAGGDGYLPWCRKCVTEIFNQLEVELGTEEAIRRMCMKLDIYWSPAVFEMTKNSSATQPRILSYLSKANLLQVKGNSYDDTLIDDEGITTINNENDLEVTAENGVKISPRAVKIFGYGYPPDVYPNLLLYYDDLVALCGDNIEPSQKKIAKQLAILEWQMGVSAQNDGGKNVSALANSYKSLFNDGGFNKVKSQNEQAFKLGCVARDIEKYTPAQWVKEHPLYRDVDHFDEYVRRFFKRPHDNVFTNGPKENDSEFVILDSDGDDADA